MLQQNMKNIYIFRVAPKLAPRRQEIVEHHTQTLVPFYNLIEQWSRYKGLDGLLLFLMLQHSNPTLLQILCKSNTILELCNVHCASRRSICTLLGNVLVRTMRAFPECKQSLSSGKAIHVNTIFRQLEECSWCQYTCTCSDWLMRRYQLCEEIILSFY